MKSRIIPLLYLTSTAALSGIVHTVYQQQTLVSIQPIEIQAAVTSLRSEGLKQIRQDRRWIYDNTKGYWSRFAKANFTCRQDVQDEKVEHDSPAVSPEAEIVDLYDVLDVLCITRGGDDSGTLIQYAKEVTVPDEFLAATPSAIPNGRRGPASREPANSTPPHHLQIGDALWPPYDEVFLIGIADDASSVLFEIRQESFKENGAFPTQEVLKRVLDLPEESLRRLRDGLIASGIVEPDVKDRHEKNDTDWRDVPSATSVDGRIQVGEKLRDFLAKNSKEIWSKDVVLKDYSHGTGARRIRGVSIRKISERLRQFGVESGDVIVSLNGSAIRGMAHFRSVGRRLYKQGVRTFRAEFIRAGRKMERTYRLTGEQ